MCLSLAHSLTLTNWQWTESETSEAPAPEHTHAPTSSWKRGSRYHGHSTDEASTAASVLVEAASSNSISHLSILVTPGHLTGHLTGRSHHIHLQGKQEGDLTHSHSHGHGPLVFLLLSVRLR